MSDNIKTTPSSSPNAKDVATDDVGGVHYQRVKLDLGADGVSEPVEGTLPVRQVSKLVPFAFDHISLERNSEGQIVSITYKTGGSSGTTVAILSLTYNEGLMSSVSRS